MSPAFFTQIVQNLVYSKAHNYLYPLVGSVSARAYKRVSRYFQILLYYSTVEKKSQSFCTNSQGVV